MNGAEETFILGLLGILKEIGHFQNLDVDGRIIFKSGFQGDSVIGRGQG